MGAVAMVVLGRAVAVGVVVYCREVTLKNSGGLREARHTDDDEQTRVKQSPIPTYIAECSAWERATILSAMWLASCERVKRG